MITEYKRDMYHNYLVIHDEDLISSDYHEQVLKYNEIAGHLKFESRMFDKKKYAYYEINGLQVLSSVFEKHTVQYLELKRIFKGVIEGVNAGKEFLLNENHYILSPNMIFFEISKSQIKLCYFPGYGSQLRIQLHNLFEFFMNKVNYNDQAAVLLIYKLYMKSKDEACTMQQLIDILEENINVDATNQQATAFNNQLNVVNKESSIDEEKNKSLSVFNKQDTQVDIKGSNQFKKSKEIKTASKKGLIEESGLNVNHSVNNVFHKLPFVSERVEGEEEILYYPLSCYVLCVGSIVGAIVLYILAYKKRFIFQELRPSIDPVKSISLLIVLAVIIVYVSIKIFDKKHKVSKMVPKIDYLQPSLTTIVNTEDSTVLKKSTNLEPFRLHSLNASWNQDPQQKDEMDEEERTVMLTNFSMQSLVKLIPVDKDTYDVIQIEEFPFFVGKLKTHIDVHIPSPTISRFHAKIIKEDSDYFIADLNSTNGTYVNGEIVKGNEKRKIEHGNEIAFANINYIFNCM